MLTAFLGNAETRAQALNRLANRFKAGELTAGALFAASGKATPAAALIDSTDAQVWQDTLGLAKWLAYALDYGSSNLPADKAVELAYGLLKAIPVGCDTEIVGSRVIANILCAVADTLKTQSGDVAPLAEVCEEIRALHQRAVEGNAPTPAQWRVARKAATAVTNEIADGPVKSFGACVEAAAWDPVAAPTTVGDVLRTWNQAIASGLNTAFGWTPEDDARIRTHLGEMHEKYKKDNPEEERDVFLLLREHYPEVEARLLSYTKFQREYIVTVSERTAKLLLETVGAVQ